ncbi:hypothetical protein DRO59_04575 [Candidatus Bathyarchaeota archaeon]|nr:MAG: hypothetical protein DRO59_04575 [Candidatus Bathyarchaeota archaeon]
METLEDLAKTAEILVRPILHTTKAKEHTFYKLTTTQNTNTQQRLKPLIKVERLMLENCLLLNKWAMPDNSSISPQSSKADLAYYEM